MSKVPPELKYAKTHEWVRLDGSVATIGVSDHAQRELTDVVFVELPAVGRQVKAGEACAVVESVKTASDIYSPVTGEITAANQSVVEDPARVNSDPYGEGWLFKVQINDPSELDKLLPAAEYDKLVNQ